MPGTELQGLNLEEYKREIAVYKSYREEISRLEEESDKLEKVKKSFDASFTFSYGVSFLIILLLIRKELQIDFSIIFSLFWLPIFPAAILGVIFDNDFFNNIFSFGKLNKIKKLQDGVEERLVKLKMMKDETYKQLQPFEKEISDHYIAQLAEFFAHNLYRKRSGGQQFEEALSEFSSIIEELSQINSNLVTTGIPLYEYKDYLKKRTVNHNLQATKKSENLTSIRNLMRKLSEPQKQTQNNKIPPERFYRTERKIDNWEEINLKRKETGQKGEVVAVVIEKDYLESIDRKDLADKVRHVSAENGDGLGYDILSFFPDGKQKYIEVKSTVGSLYSPFYLSRNELGFLREHKNDAFVYRVQIPTTSDSDPLMLVLTSEDVVKAEMTPVQYQVKINE